jgi:hypothetical protein
MRRDYKAIADRIIHKRYTSYRRKVWQALEQAYEDGRADQRAVEDIDKIIGDIRRSIAAATTRTVTANSNEVMHGVILPPPSKIQRENSHHITRLRGVRIRRPH